MRQLALFGALVLLMVSIPKAAAQNSERAWALIQGRATAAFATYEAEAAAPVRSRAALRAQRFDVFRSLAAEAGRFIGTYIPEQERRSPRYVFALFTFALYSELSGDLWRAQHYYGEVCSLSESTLRPAGIAIPKYRGVSVLRLCIQQVQRLGIALRDLGPRPTHISILQSNEEPGPDDFLRRFHERGRDFIEQVLIEGADSDRFVVLRALDRAADREQCDDACAAIETARSLAEERRLRFNVLTMPHVTVAGIAIEPEALSRIARAIDQVGASYERVHGPGFAADQPRAFIVPGTLSESDARLFELARAQNRVFERVFARPATRERRIELDDYPLLYGLRLAQVAGDEYPWAQFAMLDYAGHGLFSDRNASALIRIVVSVAGPAHALPFYDCPPVVARFCALHAGMFARFLSALPSRTDPAQSTLQSMIAARRGQNRDLDAAQVALRAITGLPDEALRARFLDFVAQGSGPSPDSPADRAAIAELRQAFTPPQPQ